MLRHPAGPLAGLLERGSQGSARAAAAQPVTSLWSSPGRTTPENAEYGTRAHTDDYELVAEAVAFKTLHSWDLTIQRAVDHLSVVGGKNWQRRLGKSYIRNRYVIAVDVLRKPLPPGSSEVRKARQEVRKAKRAERDKYYGLDRDQKNRLRELLEP